MKKNRFLFVLVLTIFYLLTACSKKMTISIDANGLASWEPIKGAVGYSYVVVDKDYSSLEDLYTTKTSVQLPEGYSIHVTPVMKNGDRGDTVVSEYYGEPVSGFGDAYYNTVQSDLLVESNRYDLKVADLLTYEVVSNINYDTVTTLEDGRVYFEAEGPDGAVMRFMGKGIAVSEGEITIEPSGHFTALDAIGRICAYKPTVKNPGNPENAFNFLGGYTFNEKTSVNTMDELYFSWPRGIRTNEALDENYGWSEIMDYQPNFIALGGYAGNLDAYSISELKVYYDTLTYNTGIKTMGLFLDHYGSYIEGDTYDAGKEIYDSEKRIYTFHLLAVPEVYNEVEPFDYDLLRDDLSYRSIQDIPMSKFSIGELKDSAGNVLDKDSGILSLGSTLEVTIQDYTFDMPLPILERYAGAQTLHELIPYDNATSIGETVSLVVPVAWQDEEASEEILNKIKMKLGRVEGLDGSVVDYSDELENAFSLSEYYDVASYGNHSITSIMTDWYYAPYDFSVMQNVSSTDEEFMTGLTSWVYETYSDLDWSRLDADDDGFIDSLIIINNGTTDDELNMNTFDYAIHYSPRYTGENAGTLDKPSFKNYITMNHLFLDGNTIIHEYAHRFGIVDYYDVTYSGINALGNFDMQSGSYGDWNSYSKYAVGWIEPKVIQNLNAGESIDLTIGAFNKTGDSIVIPAADAEHDGPFNEYIMIDLFTDGGVNQYDADFFDLNGKTGVRIYHVSSNMEKRILTVEGVDYPIGTVHHTNVYNQKGKYLLELIQAKGENTFTDLDNLRTQLNTSDLFKEGDLFSLERYKEFFVDGKLDNQSDFGYIVEIVDINENQENSTATIRITRE